MKKKPAAIHIDAGKTNTIYKQYYYLSNTLWLCIYFYEKNNILSFFFNGIAKYA